MGRPILLRGFRGRHGTLAERVNPFGSTFISGPPTLNATQFSQRGQLARRPLALAADAADEAEVVELPRAAARPQRAEALPHGERGALQPIPQVLPSSLGLARPLCPARTLLFAMGWPTLPTTSLPTRLLLSPRQPKAEADVAPAAVAVGDRPHLRQR
jgi:hypothetical protein